MNELKIPDSVDIILNKIKSLEIILVTDDRTNTASLENIKYYKQEKESIKEIIKPVKEELYRPYKAVTSAETAINTEIDLKIKQQSEQSAIYLKAEREKLNESQPSEFAVTTMKSKSEFVTGSSKAELDGVVTDLVVFIQTLLEQGKFEWIQAIFGKYNPSELKKFLKLMGVKNYPGLAIKEIEKLKTY